MTTVLTGLAVSRDASNNGTTPKGFRLAIGGLLAKNGASGVDVRKGVLWDNGTNVVTGNAGMTYSVRSCNVVVMPSATQGPIVVPNDATISIATTAAPGSNSRIDIIWVRQHLVAADGGADSDVIGEWGVTQGTAAASPSAPAIPTGALELARATVTAGTVATNTLTISQTHLWTTADGSPVPVRTDTERSALTAFDGALVNHLGSDQLQRYNGSAWQTVGSADSGWTNVTLAAGYTTQSVGMEPKFRKVGPAVYLSGLVKKTAGSFTSGATVTIGTLPSGSRPTENTYYPLVVNDETTNGRLVILTTGDVQVQPGAAATYTSVACTFLSA